MKRIAVVSALTVAVTSFAIAPSAMAEGELDEARLGVIRANCVSAQSTIQRVGRTDTTSRINRGRSYDAVLKLFYAMNSRLASNNMTVPKLAEITKEFEGELQNFRNYYNKYNSDFKSSLDVNCVNNPVGFYDNLSKTRASRQLINSAILKMDALINDYEKVIEELEL